MSNTILDPAAADAPNPGEGKTPPGVKTPEPPASGDKSAVNLERIYNSDGSFVAKWWEQFPETSGLGAQLGKFPSPVQLAKSYSDLETLRRPPAADAPEDVVERWRRATGIDADRYGEAVRAPEELPAGVEMSPERLQAAAELGLAAHCTPEQTNQWLQFGAQVLGEEAARAADAARSAAEARQAEFDQWVADQRLEVTDVLADARGALVQFGILTTEQAQGKTAVPPEIGNNLPLIQLAYKAAQSLSEGRMVAAGREGAPGSGTGDVSERKRLAAHPALNDPSHPEHGAISEQYAAVAGRSLLRKKG